MDGPSRPPYRLDLDNGPVLGIGPDPKSERDFRRLRFSFFRQELASPTGDVCLHRACSSGG